MIMKKTAALLLSAVLLFACGCSLRTRQTENEKTTEQQTVSTSHTEIMSEKTTREETETVTQAQTEETVTFAETAAKSDKSKSNTPETTAQRSSKTTVKQTEKTTKKQSEKTTSATKSVIENIISTVNDIVTTTATTTHTAGQTTGEKLSFTTTDINGNSVSMSDYSDYKVIIVNMWEPWCGPCVREMPDLQKLYTNYKDQGVLVIGVYSTEENAKTTVDSTGITYPVIRKTAEFNKYDTGYVPTTIIVDGNGNVLSSEPLIGSKSYSEWESTVKTYLK